MDGKALDIVGKYVFDHLDKSDTMSSFEVYIVWKVKVLQNWKYLISTSLPDGMYYELTYNGDKKEWYLDAYKKFENLVIKENADTEQAAESEQCKNCRHYEFASNRVPDEQCWVCRKFDYECMPEDGFCCFWERRERKDED